MGAVTAVRRGQSPSLPPSPFLSFSLSLSPSMPHSHPFSLFLPYSLPPSPPPPLSPSLPPYGAHTGEPLPLHRRIWGTRLLIIKSPNEYAGQVAHACKLLLSVQPSPPLANQACFCRRYTAVLYQLTETVAAALADASIDMSPWPATLALALAADPAAGVHLGGPAEGDTGGRP